MHAAQTASPSPKPWCPLTVSRNRELTGNSVHQAGWEDGCRPPGPCACDDKGGVQYGAQRSKGELQRSADEPQQERHRRPHGPSRGWTLGSALLGPARHLICGRCGSSRVGVGSLTSLLTSPGPCWSHLATTAYRLTVVHADSGIEIPSTGIQAEASHFFWALQQAREPVHSLLISLHGAWTGAHVGSNFLSAGR